MKVPPFIRDVHKEMNRLKQAHLTPQWLLVSHDMYPNLRYDHRDLITIHPTLRSTMFMGLHLDTSYALTGCEFRVLTDGTT